MFEMKTISIRLEDSIYEELGAMLDAMGQTKQTFYETFTRTALRERSIPFIIKAPLTDTPTNNNSKLEAFARLEASRKASAEAIDYNVEREEAMNEKFGIVD
jgi:antitoxin component of RelBE/YafQ-DinJ toxin-antitoxin module